jgi:membrane protein YqaA with SNARE-associated domain
LRIFQGLYDATIKWAGHPHAEYYLAGLSFAESSFFPIPPDVMLAPMTLAAPRKGWRFAAVTTVASVLGGLAGYMIGWLALDAITPLLQRLEYWDEYQRANEWFIEWGFLAVLAAGFTPIPYKIFTISAGALGMLLPVFVLASLIGRGARFFLVAGLIVLGGPPMERGLRRHVDTIGWITVILVVLLFFWFRD